MTRPDIVLIGAQGSGKGTQAYRLVDRHKFQIIGTGELLRSHVEAGDALGAQVAPVLARGELVSDEIIDQLVRREIQLCPPGQPIVFDGFPRNVKQAQLLETYLLGFTRPPCIAVSLVIPKTVILERIRQRHVCPTCRRIYAYSPSLDPKLCKDCRTVLLPRVDDQAAVVETRLNHFYALTLPVIDFYRAQGRLIEINAEGTVDAVTRDIEAEVHLL